jgi:hypothetical protein
MQGRRIIHNKHLTSSPLFNKISADPPDDVVYMSVKERVCGSIFNPVHDKVGIQLKSQIENGLREKNVQLAR